MAKSDDDASKPLKKVTPEKVTPKKVPRQEPKPVPPPPGLTKPEEAEPNDEYL